MIRKLAMCIGVLVLSSTFTGASALADEGVDGAIRSAEAICGNLGRFNGAICLCTMSDDFGLSSHGECVEFLSQRILRAPACDGPLRDFDGNLREDRECGGRDPQD